VSGVAPQPGQGPLGPIYTTHGYAGVGKEIALTFDDGPNPVYTPQILDELNAAGVRATFFLVGRHAALYPDLVRAEWLAGDTIGNHTFGHEWIPGLSSDRLQATLDKAAQAIRSATTDPCLWLFRPPYGQLIPPVRAPTPAHTPGPGTPPAPTPTQPVQVPVQVTQAWKTVYGRGYTSVDWDIDAADWTLPGAQVIAQRIIKQLHPGAIILLHDGAPDGEKQDRSQTVAALPAILAAIKARGLQPVTLPRMLLDAGLIKRPTPPSPTPTQTPLSDGAVLLLAPLGLARRVRHLRHLRYLPSQVLS
jgi:peptidoglycan/xylan/chitin deacetylase (PgdA/CDA1 family)